MALPMHRLSHACGKVILLGEHAVVHGQPALAAGLPGGIVLEAQPREDALAPSKVAIPDWDLDVVLHPDSDHPVARACLEVLGLCDGPVTGWVIRGRSELPARAGLGSSAALTVALARLVLGQDAPIETVVDASMAGERIFHGEPSGIDSEVAARGGVVRFVRGERAEPIPLGRSLRLVVVPSGIGRSTAIQVAKVRAKLERMPRLARPVVELLGVAVGLGIAAIQANDLEQLGEIFSTAHELLTVLDVSSPELDALCSLARSSGALGAKLTGAGGGGSIVAVPPVDAGQLVAALRERGLAPLSVEVGP
jgi:mevalonate kinase